MPKRTDTNLAERYKLLERITASAEEHGQASELEHEVGDLQDALKVCFEQMTDEQAAAVTKTFFVDHDEWGEEGPIEDQDEVES